MMHVETLPIPCKNKVLVEVEVLPDRTVSGLYIPETAQNKHVGKRGTVVGVGSECKLGMKPGDIVFFEQFVGARIYFKVGDGTPKDHLIVTEDAILGILEEESNG